MDSGDELEIAEQRGYTPAVKGQRSRQAGETKPKGSSVLQALNKKITPMRAKAIAEAILKRAEKGEFRYCQLILDHQEGKPSQRVRVDHNIRTTELILSMPQRFLIDRDTLEPVTIEAAEVSTNGGNGSRRSEDEDHQRAQGSGEEGGGPGQDGAGPDRGGEESPEESGGAPRGEGRGG